MTTKLNLVWTYITECARLLYWIYFKPFTFRAWLKEIHPELKMETNPFWLRGEFPNNPRLLRYAEQSWWLSFAVPVLAVLIIGPIYTLATNETFNWGLSCLFLLGWSIGLIPMQIDNPRFSNGIYGFLALLVLFFLLGSLLDPSLFNVLGESLILILRNVVLSVMLGVALGVAWGVASSVAWGVALGVVFSVVFNVTLGVAFIVTVGVALGVALGVASGVTWGIALSVVPGVASSIVLGVTVNVVLSVVFGVAWILGVFRVYFWIPELLWSMVLVLGSRLSRADRFLPYLPQRFDQLIYLPLPFLDILIADAYRQNAIAAQRTLDYLLTSTNQQSLAARAMVQISIDCLYQCENLSAITVIADQLAWLSSPPPKQLGTILPRFLEISQSVRAATLATSPYRQAELLASPLTALERLQNELAFSPDARLAANFGGITQRWRQIIQQTRQDLEATATYTREIPSAYLAGPTLNPDTAQHRFKGREDIFARVETLALSPQPPVLLLYGGRRTGKTSALKYLPERVGGQLVPLLVDLQGGASATTLPGLAEYIADEMIAVARKSRNLRLPEPNRRSLQEDPFLALQQWLKQIETIAPEKRFLLCLDEFERLSEVVTATSSRAPLNFLRHILQHRERWILLFSGSHTLDELDDYWSDYLINTQSLRVTYLEPHHARELILHPIPDFPDIYNSEAIEHILELTRCQPYLLQLVGLVLVDTLNARLRQSATASAADLSKVTPQDVETVIPKVLETGGHYFRELWKQTLLDAEREALKFILRGEAPQNVSPRVLTKLVQKEVIELGEDGMYRLQVPLVQRSLSQLMHDEAEN